MGLLVAALAVGADGRLLERSQANPVRKVVTLLQKMQEQVTKEGEKEKELYDKFVCYCKTGTGDLEQSIDAAEAKIASLAADVKAAEAEKAKTEEALAQA